MLGRNTRAWALDEVEAWLAARPTAKKVVHGRKQQHDEVEKASILHAFRHLTTRT
jgi:hypothetical protein